MIRCVRNTFPFALLTGIAIAQGGQATNAVFNPTADAKEGIAAAVKKARHDNKQVLVMFGGNWCEWCHKLVASFNDPKTARMLRYEYVLVTVDIGKWDKNQDIAKKYEAEIRTEGVPYLTVLSGDGNPVAHSATKPLRTGGNIDPSKVWAFLEKHRAEPLDAADVLAAAREKAKIDNKTLFIYLSAPG